LAAYNSETIGVTMYGDTQGRNEGGKGGTIPRAPNHCGGRRKVLKLPQVFSSIQYICFRKTSVSNMGRQTRFLPGRHLTSLRPWRYACG